MIEILGYNLAPLFENTRLNGICTYKGIPKKEFDITYEVWEVDEDSFLVMCEITEERFKVYCPKGWWRQSDGSNLGYPMDNYIINGKPIIAWDGYDKQHWYKDCARCKSKYKEMFEDGEIEECNGAYTDWEECNWGREYSTITAYLSCELGASTEKNVCALLTDLAKYNDMKMSELLKKYEE